MPRIVTVMPKSGKVVIHNWELWKEHSWKIMESIERKLALNPFRQ